MDKQAVPQDASPTYGGLRKLLYAVDEAGRYSGVQSSGWEVESYATELAVGELERQATDAWQRAQSGATSVLEYHMYKRRLDPPTLSAITGLWQWRVRRHLRPQVFSRLGEATLARYADALGISVTELRTLPAAP